jgi:Mg2+ and Co2+ transporter CorA
LAGQLRAERHTLEANVANAAAVAAQQALSSLHEAYQQEQAARLGAQRELNKKLRYLTIAVIILFLMIIATFIFELRFIVH